MEYTDPKQSTPETPQVSAQISDGDVVFDRDAATVDRVARNRPTSLPASAHEERDFDEGEGEGWGFRIRSWVREHIHK